VVVCLTDGIVGAVACTSVAVSGLHMYMCICMSSRVCVNVWQCVAVHRTDGIVGAGACTRVIVTGLHMYVPICEFVCVFVCLAVCDSV